MTGLRHLFNAIKAGEIELSEDLPVYSDYDYEHGTGVWSWDDSHAIRGTCVEDLKIVPRDDKWFVSVDARALERLLAFTEGYEDEIDDSKFLRQSVDSLSDTLHLFASENEDFDIL